LALGLYISCICFGGLLRSNSMNFLILTAFLGFTFTHNTTYGAPSVKSQQTTLSIKVISFSQWKDQQVLDSENRVARLNNKLTAIKKDSQQARALRSTEVELKSAIQSLEVAREFTIEHYAASYVTQFTGSKEALQNLAQVLTPAEVAELLYFLAQTKAAATPANSKLTPFVTGLPKANSSAL
jgi:hypothetical protein